MKDESQEKLAEEMRHLLADEQDPPLFRAEQLALEDQEFLKQLLDGLVSKDDVYRYNCFKVLLQLSQSHPLALIANWDYFVELLGSRNAYHRSVALQIIAQLTRVDGEGRFEEIFDAYQVGLCQGDTQHHQEPTGSLGSHKYGHRVAMSQPETIPAAKAETALRIPLAEAGQRLATRRS